MGPLFAESIVQPGSWLALIIGIFGLGGIIFTALRFRRDDTTAILGQQDTILGEMRGLNEEMRTTAARLREERDELRIQVERLGAEVAALRAEIRGMGMGNA